MCYFVTLVAGGVPDGRVAEIAKAHGRRAALFENPGVQAVLRSGELQFVTTIAHCDCGTVLAPIVADGGRSAEDTMPDDIARLRLRGWSEAKIDRWRRDRLRSAARPKRVAHDSRPDSAAQWAAILADLLATSREATAGLLVRFYRRDVETERFEVARRVRRLDDFGGVVEDFPADTVVMFTA